MTGVDGMPRNEAGATPITPLYLNSNTTKPLINPDQRVTSLHHNLFTKDFFHHNLFTKDSITIISSLQRTIITS